MIFGLEPVHPLPDGWTPLEAVCVVKCLDETGHVSYSLRATTGQAVADSIAMLTGALDVCRKEFRDSFAIDGEED